MAAKSIHEGNIHKIRSRASNPVNKFLKPWPIDRVKPCIEIFHRQFERYDIVWSVPIIDSIQFLQERGFLKVDQVIFLVHGFTDNITDPWMHTLKNAILKDSDKTVCICGWGGGADLAFLEYFQAVMNTETAGKWFGKFAQAIKNQAPSLKLWGIGHSLGAHVMGWTGHHSNQSFNRITGLDPAGPGYEEAPNWFRSLNKDDATDMVDIIHTDGYGPPCLRILHLGTLVPLGTIDFYPNFGEPKICKEKGIHYYHQWATTLMIQSVTQGDKFKCSNILDGTPGFDKPVTSVKTADGIAMMGYHADRSDCQHTGLWYLVCDTT